MTYISLKRKNKKRLRYRNKNQIFCCFLTSFGFNTKFSVEAYNTEEISAEKKISLED
jgi:hypothetical protein